MAFSIRDYFYLYFWSAAVNALIFWELLRLFNAARPTGEGDTEPLGELLCSNFTPDGEMD